ncbi:SGNH/GDSL hydrolase family protein [Actinoplanes sp. N902-109]|uniref:GDSL-type esterase/lipase family protein n=1 Tax=Actinoplanes sp. (strain N902-109) TaxID=649831 RepID=UPI00059F2AD9|nr:SGNH/GDSL hydrolase family protein [Actinoplanes sp. N902-109]
MISVPLTADLLRGACELERTERGLLPHRLPAWARAQTPDPQLAMMEAQPSGVRLTLRTRATTIELDTLPTRLVYPGFPPRPEGVYDVLINGVLAARSTADGGNTITVTMSDGTTSFAHGEVATLRFDLPEMPDASTAGPRNGRPGAASSRPHDDRPRASTGGRPVSPGVGAGRDRIVEIWLPHNERTELVALRADAPVEPAPPSGRPVWLHHGSSISHGSNAATPSGTWPALAATQAGVELINLGLGGSALLDPFIARFIRDSHVDVISIKMGINIVNADAMQVRTFGPAVHGFIDTIRDGHPDTPLMFVSPIFCPIHEDTPGPGAFDLEALREGKVAFRATGRPGPGKLTLRVIRDELARIVGQRSAEDKNLHYLDGLALYGEADADELPLPDRLHPDAATHRLIGTRFADLGLHPLLSHPA